MVLGNVGTSDDIDVLARTLDDEAPLVRAHAAWALEHIVWTRPHRRLVAPA